MVLSIMFGQVMNPMVLSFLVVMMGLVVVIMLGYVLPMFWFSYVILLTFLGGLLVVFVYVASLCPNEPIMKFGGWGWGLVIVVMFISFGWESSSDLYYSFGLSDLSNLVSIYYEGVESLIIFLVVYLFLVLLAVVDLSLVFKGSLSVNYDKKWAGD
nr:NADH dehydrogenase subunit 6 [Nedyopus patrioticus unicolor]